MKYPPNKYPMDKVTIGAKTAAEPAAWQNIDRIIDALEAAGCCRNGQIMAPEDHVANTIRNWLHSLNTTPPVKIDKDALYAALRKYLPLDAEFDSMWQEVSEIVWPNHPSNNEPNQ